MYSELEPQPLIQACANIGSLDDDLSKVINVCYGSCYIN